MLIEFTDPLAKLPLLFLLRYAGGADGDEDALRELVEKENIAFRVALDKPSFSDYPGAMFEKCNVTKPPSVYIIGADGTVKFQDLALAVVEEAVERVIAGE